MEKFIKKVALALCLVSVFKTVKKLFCALKDTIKTWKILKIYKSKF